MKNKNILWFYIIIVFITSYIWQLAIFFTGGIDSILFPFVMWFPGIAAIVFRLITKEGLRNVGWGFRKWWYTLPAILLPAMVTLTCILLLSTLEWATWSDKFFIFNNGMVEIPKAPMILGNHPQRIAFFALNFGLSLGLQAVIGSLFTLGEEFGWQGYLVQKLLRKYGLNWGLVILGIIWGYWHMPIILMGYNFPNHPIFGALILMPLSTIFIGIFQSWLYLKSKSIWMPMLAHAAANITAPILFSGMAMNMDELIRQLTWIVVWGIIAMICLLSLNNNRPALWQEKFEIM
jgi:membrane protease YdiL (CAAX protease family)